VAAILAVCLGAVALAVRSRRPDPKWALLAELIQRADSEDGSKAEHSNVR
jgi:hypothetical protein